MQCDNIEKEVYLPSDIMKILGISRTSCYEFLNEVYKHQSPFRVLKIKTSIRVPKESFNEWLRSS